MTIVPMRLDDARVAPLLADLAAEYEARYGPGNEMASTAATDFDPPHGLFLLLLGPDGVAVAGGGYRRLTPQVCEVKRMWTHRDQRRRGHAARVLGALEAAAVTAGYVAVRLETGPFQPEAEALYLQRGYSRIPTFGRYPRALAFERRLLS